MKKTLIALAICGFTGMNLMADSMDSRTITVGDTTVTAYRDGAPSTNHDVYAIPHDGKVILVNAGVGGEDGFLKHFIADGHKSDDITAVLLTNMRGDTIGGLLDGCATRTKVEGGGIIGSSPGAIFRNATLYISKSEKKYWDNFPRVRNPLTPPPLAQQAISAYADRIVTFDSDTEIFPGITAIQAVEQTQRHPGSIIFATRDIMFISDFSKSNSGMDDGSGILELIKTARKAVHGDDHAKQEIIKEMRLENVSEKISFDWIERLANNTKLEARATKILEAKREREKKE